MYCVFLDGLRSQTVQMKSIVPLLPRSGDIAGRQDMAMIASGLVAWNRSNLLAACQYVDFRSIANGTLKLAACLMKSAAKLKGGLVMIDPQLQSAFKKFSPVSP